MQIQKSYSKLYLSIISILGWFAIIAQFVLFLQNANKTVQEVVVRFFSFFTIDTNLLVTICATTLWLFPKTKIGHFFNKQTTLAAIAIYILVVSLIYNFILRFLWQPQGLQKWVDELLHSVVPALYIVFWLCFAAKNQLQWKHVWSWLIYPLTYTVFILIRGYFSSFYPYPFINATILSAKQVAINCVGIAVLFALLSLLFIWVGKLSERNRS